MQPNQPIIFFDGYCGLCNRFVDFIIVRDKQKVFRYAPLQGTTAQELAKGHAAFSRDSVVYYNNGKFYTGANAVSLILKRLGFFYKVAGHSLAIFPGFLSERLYDWVASKRFYWFGRKDTCRIPGEKERGLFLE